MFSQNQLIYSLNLTLIYYYHKMEVYLTFPYFIVSICNILVLHNQERLFLLA